jgi:Glycosyl hydrolase family 63 N-terminal domain
MRRSWLLLLLPLLSSTLAATNDSESLVWGTWRPGLYFGLRPRLPQSLMTGLIWFGTQDFESFMRPSELYLHVASVLKSLVSMSRPTSPM